MQLRRTVPTTRSAGAWRDLTRVVQTDLFPAFVRCLDTGEPVVIDDYFYGAQFGPTPSP